MRRLLLSIVPALAACRVLDEQHCANLAGDATCREQGVGLEYCDRCVSAHDGCVATPPRDPECSSESTSTSTSDGASTTTTVTATTEPSGSTTTNADDGASTSTSDGASTSVAGTSSDSAADTVTTAASSDETADLEVCGDGVSEGAEECDGEDLRGLDCAGLPDFADGELACDPTCVLDTSGCTACHGTASPCSSDAECCSESCSGLGLCL